MMISTKDSTLIGTGAFTRAFLRPSGRVMLISRCPVKSAMALPDFPYAGLFPHIEKFSEAAPYTYYEMDYYPATFKSVEALVSVLADKKSINFVKTFLPAVEYSQIPSKDLRTKLGRQFKEAYQFIDAHVSGTVVLDFHYKNLAAKAGKIILLDSMYSADEAKKVNQRKVYV